MGFACRFRTRSALLVATALAVQAIGFSAGTAPAMAQQPVAPKLAPAQSDAAAPQTDKLQTLPGVAPKGGQVGQSNEPAPPTQAVKPQAPSQQGNVKETHGAWSIVCDKPAGASTEQCAMMQNVIAEDRPEVGLSVVVLKTADRKARILRILAPLGVLLKDGMELYVDNNNIGRAYFTRCFSEGCYVEVELDDELLRILRAGKSAVFALRESADQDRVGIPVELSGFGEGYDALP